MAKPADFARELELLIERPRAFAETEDLPRSRHPALFRAARAATPDELAALAAELGTRLPDRPLLEPAVELARELEPFRAKLALALAARAAAPDAWTSEKQAKLAGGLEGVLALAADPPAVDPTTSGGAPARTLLEIVEVRMRAPAARRDRLSLEVARGALHHLRAHARDAAVAALAARVAEAETRRAGKDDPELAVAALEVLAGAEPLAKLRAARRLAEQVDRKKVHARARELVEQATAELGASKEDVADLLADAGGLPRSGELEIPLEDGATVRVRLDASGRPAVEAPRALAADEKREVDAATAAIVKARADHAERLERALAAGRSWALGLFRSIYLAENALLRDLATRLVWLALPARVAFRPTREGALEDVFGSSVVLDEKTTVRVAHPVELDADELGLWRERFLELGGAKGRPLVQAVHQLFRPVRREPGADLSRFAGRELYEQDLVDFARARGYRGVPLRGDGPFELAREFPGRQALLAVTVDRVASATPPPKVVRKDALRVFDDPDAPKKRVPRDAAPRLRVVKAEFVGDDPVALSESARDLHELTDLLDAGTDGFFGDWQKKKFKDPAQFWRDAQLKLMRASEAKVEVRKALLALFGIAVTLQGRLALLPGELFLEVGSRHAFEGPLRDWVPPWKLEERLRPVDLAWPFEPALDEETVAVVSALAHLSKATQKSVT